MKTDQEIVGDFLKAHGLAVVSTVTSNHLPQSAVVGIHVGSDMSVVFGTFRASRKFANIQKSPSVSLVIGWEQGKTIQYEGEAVELSGNALVEFEKAHLGTMSTVAKHFPKDQAVFYRVTPKWIRYTDLSRDPWDIIELRF